MNARRLVLAGGTVAFTAIGVVSARRRKPRGARSRSPLHAVTAVPLAVAVAGTYAYGWSIDSVFTGLLGFFTGIAGDIKDFVYGVVDRAVNFVLDVVGVIETGIKGTLSLVTGTIGIMADQISNVASAVGHVVNQTVQFVDDAFSNFRDQLKSFLEHAWDDLKDWVLTNIPDWIGDALGGLKDLLDGLIELGTDGISLLLNFVRDPIGFVWDLISDLVESAIAVAIDAAGLGWDVFWGLFWPLLARQLDLPENPDDMIAAAKLLFHAALLLITGDVTGAGRDLLQGAKSYIEQQVPQLIRNNSDLLIELIYEAMGIREPPGVVESLRNA